MGKLCIGELDAFIHASTHQIGPPKEDSTYGMLGDRVVHQGSHTIFKTKFHDIP